MAKIRSALEIALEKTEGVKEDPEKIRQQQLTETGKRLFSTFFFEGQKDAEEVKADIDATDEHDRSMVLSGFISTLLSNINLPKNDLYVEEMGKVKKAAEVITISPEELTELFQQLDRFFQQYLQQKEQLSEQLKSQYMPKLREKQQKLAQQFGSAIELTPEQDPEFMEMLGKYEQQMDEKYQEVLDQIKEQIKTKLRSS